MKKTARFLITGCIWGTVMMTAACSRPQTEGTPQSTDENEKQETLQNTGTLDDETASSDAGALRTVMAEYDENLKAILGEGLIYEILEDEDNNTLAMMVATYNDVALEDITIPDTVIYEDKEYKVTEIKASAFESNALLQKITLPEGIRNVGDSAFYSCPELAEVVLSDTVESIGESCFAECGKLSAVTMSKSLISIGMEAFCNCTALESIMIPAKTASFGSAVFYGCESLEKCLIEEGVSQIGAEMFTNCYALKDIDIPDSVTVIGEEAFWYCTSLTNLELSEYVITIGDGAFYGSGITDLTIRSVSVQPAESMLRGCDELKTIYVPKQNIASYESAYSSRGCKIEAVQE